MFSQTEREQRGQYVSESLRIIERRLKEVSKTAHTLLDGGIVGADRFVNVTCHIVGFCMFIFWLVEASQPEHNLIEYISGEMSH